MPINANLLNALARPVRSVQDYQDDYTRQDIAQQGLQRNALLMQEAQAVQQDRERTRMDGDTLRNALQALPPGATYEQRISAMEGTNLPAGYTQADALRQALMKQRQGAATAGKDEAATATSEQNRKIEADKQVRARLQGAQNPKEAADIARAAVAGGFWDQSQAMSALDGMPVDLTQFDGWRQRQLAGALAPKDLLPNIQTRNTGGSTDTLAVNPLTGMPTMTGSVRNTQSPDNKASVGASYANASAVRDQAQAVRDAAKITTRSKDETDLRKEFADLPEVKKYKNAIPAYQSIVNAAKINNPQADINLIYGLAKLYDPDSVVREGEYDTIANSQSIPEWLKGQAQRLAGGGRLTQETKGQILEQAGIRVGAYKSEVAGAQESYDKIARGRGLDPANVFPAVGGQMAKPAAGGGVPDMSAIDAEIARRKKGK